MDNVPIRINNPITGRNNQSANGGKKQGQSKGKLFTIIISIAVILIAGVTGFVCYKSSLVSHIDNGKYQAVFLSNGQVYFGKLEKMSGGYFKLTDIFYLQTSDENTTTVQDSSNDSSDVELIKLGSEVHGPEDEMIIDKDQILFFENLKTDGTVTSSITQYYEQLSE